MSDTRAGLAPHAWAALCELRLRGTMRSADPGPTGELELMGWALRRGELAVREVHERFGPLNARLLRLCTDWQQRPGGVPNDHSDPDYDTRTLDRLAAALDSTRAELCRLSAADPRFAGYADRLDAALRRADRGDPEEPLCALGASRADEQPVL